MDSGGGGATALASASPLAHGVAGTVARGRRGSFGWRAIGWLAWLVLAGVIGVVHDAGLVRAAVPEPVVYDPGIPALPAAGDKVGGPPKAAEAPVKAVETEPSARPDATPVVAPPVAASGDGSESAKASVPETLDDRHRLAVGDRISLRIVEDEDEPRPLLVTDSGEIEVPYIGRRTAAGRTCRELARELKEELEKEYYYQATVLVALDLMARSRGRIYLVGPVRAPGPQEIPSDETLTLSKAILRAGGFLETADKRNVRVTRKKVPGPGEELMTVNVAEILEKGRSSGDIVLEVGDLIYIPERLIRF